MKIVRCLWGTDTKFDFECRSIQSDKHLYNGIEQIVFVWDTHNKELMDELGYKSIYMGYSDEYSELMKFHYKLDALKLAMEMYDEIIFLDWDCNIKKELDDNFIKTLQNGNDIQMPLYFYPNEILNEFSSISPYVKEEQHYYNILFYTLIRLAKWKFNDGVVVPNAGFIYCRNSNFIQELISLVHSEGLSTNIEELAAMLYFQKEITSLDEYINKYEPMVCVGRGNDEMRGKQKILNEYIESKMAKEKYFIHE
jgi:hypothetical protein